MELMGKKMVTFCKYCGELHDETALCEHYDCFLKSHKNGKSGENHIRPGLNRGTINLLQITVKNPH